MNKFKFVAVAVFCLAVLAGLVEIGTAAEENNGEAALYLSVFWVGQSKTICTARGSLLTESMPECEAEHLRGETEMKQLVKRRNARGGKWIWGVFEKCVELPNPDAYDTIIAKYKNKCSGK